MASMLSAIHPILWGNGLHIGKLSGEGRVLATMMGAHADAEALFDWAENDVIFPYLKAQHAAGVSQSFGADAWSAFPNLTPALVDEWVVPSAKRLAVRAKHELGMTASAGLAACDYCQEDPTRFDKKIMFDCWKVARKTRFINVAFSAMGRTQEWDMRWLQEFAVHAVRTLGRYPIPADLNKIEVETPRFRPFDEWLKGRPEEETILRARK